MGRVVNILVFLHRLGRWQKWISEVPDVVIASSTYPMDIRPAARLARFYGARLVWEVHDLWPLSPIELGGMSRWNPLIVWMQRAENYACQKADVVVSMLPRANLYLVGQGMRLENFSYIPNGIDPAEWGDLASHSIPARHQRELFDLRAAGRKLIAYAGAHGVANALGTILDAAALCRDLPVTFLLIGNGAEKISLQARCTSLGLSNVVFLDQVPKSTIPALLRQMDILYIGLQRQSLFRFGISPNKLMDYMMAERPVICAIDAGNDPVTEAQCGLTVLPENPEALTAAIRDLIARPDDELVEMGARGRAYVETMHTYPVLAKRFLAAVQGSRT